MEIFRFSTATEQLAEQTKHIACGPARQSSLAHVSAQTKAQLLTAEFEECQAAGIAHTFRDSSIC